MLIRSSLPSEYLTLFEKNYYWYVFDWSATAPSSATQHKNLGNTRTDMGRFQGWGAVSLNVSRTTTVSVNITAVGRYNTVGGTVNPTNISATSVAINSTTIVPGTYVVHTPTSDAGSGILSIAPGDPLGLTLSFSAGGNTISGRTWIFGYHLR